MFNHMDIRAYFLTGRIGKQLCNISSNLYKFFTPINKMFNNLIDIINNTYKSIYPCLGDKLITQHEAELGIPDNTFKNYNVHTQGFPYTFPIIFSDNFNVNLEVERANDVIVKKYLMQDNSFNGFKAIAGQYNMCIQMQIQPRGTLTIGFPYKFPIVFVEPIPINPTNGNQTLITIYGGSSVQYAKLKNIFLMIKPISTTLVFKRGRGVQPYAPIQFCKKG